MLYYFGSGMLRNAFARGSSARTSGERRSELRRGGNMKFRSDLLFLYRKFNLPYLARTTGTAV